MKQNVKINDYTSSNVQIIENLKKKFSYLFYLWLSGDVFVSQSGVFLCNDKKITMTFFSPFCNVQKTQRIVEGDEETQPWRIRVDAGGDEIAFFFLSVEMPVEMKLLVEMLVEMKLLVEMPVEMKLPVENPWRIR